MTDFRSALGDRLEEFLILLQAEIEDPAGAAEVYRQAVDSLNPYQASLATLRLGHLLTYVGDIAGAVHAYQETLDRGQGDIVAEAALRLGNLLYENARFEEAISAYRRAAGSGHPEYAPEGAIRLGNVLLETGHHIEAVSAYEEASGSGHPKWRPVADRELEKARSLIGRVPPPSSDLEMILRHARLVWEESVAQDWLSSPNCSLGGARPLDVLALEGPDEVLAAIEAAAAGAY
jgi:tetratricopeptide (TPR) repeat protein